MSAEHDDPTSELRRELEFLRAQLVPKAEGQSDVLPTPEQMLFRAKAAERRRRRTVIAAVATVAAALVIGVGSWRAVRTGDAPTMADPTRNPQPSSTQMAYVSAPQVLRAAAVASSRQGDTTDAPYWRIRSVQDLPEGTVEREIWLGRGRPGVVKQGGASFRIPSATFSVGQMILSWDQLRGLPTGTESLVARLGLDEGPSTDERSWQLFKSAGELLAESPASPRVRAALWRALATVPGVQFHGNVVDSKGRPGYAVKFAVPGHPSTTYIVDPANGRLLERRYGPTRAGVPGWTVTYLTWGPASSAPLPAAL